MHAAFVNSDNIIYMYNVIMGQSNIHTVVIIYCEFCFLVRSMEFQGKVFF